MAGNYKPDDTILIASKREANYTFLSDITTEHGYGDGVWKAAFDGGTGGLYMTYDLKIKFNNTVNIYGIDSYGLGNGNKSMNIFNEDKSKLLNDKYFNKVNNIYYKWDILFNNVPPGIYVINCSNSGRDSLLSELFIEEVSKNILKSNNKYYNPIEKYYDIVNKAYTSIPITSENNIKNIIENEKFNINDLFKENTINDETFKPIDKFKSFSIVRLG